MLCRVAALKSGPVHGPLCSLYFTFGPLRSAEINLICLDPYILNSFSYLDPISINVSQCMTSLLKLEITVYFLAFIASSSWVTEED